MGLHLNEGGDDLQETHEINVTPFIDVMLVLLIIFMVAAPLATVDIKVDLPASTAKPAPRPDKPIYLSIKEDQSLYLDNIQVPQERLGAELDKLTNADKDKTIFVRGDKSVDYGKLMEVMDAMRGAGYLKIGLVGLETVGK
ncbi:biopolymer transport protein ExbD [Pseudomonas solani]|jgi:biopolymer transport protein ExbD|uniref:Biopolymer transport protein ExbD n=1 Tax=Pseudomonas solani TaxID=2731552 RepID=A0AAU7Y3J7_9PSED|nr:MULTISPECIES: TonB system transport protein ExbD [Pseudomonas]EQM69823.1 biopolymer transporter ExbD [Pseudomonas alcaligenes OT 69]MBB4818044.1 biopolymer transport protein ExbD [Pseudomonas alcaligenes]MDN4143586.1 TonB system transport protein ExbD [Pseudomonas tohonis]MDU9411239.1 TonB system transport protein ExbD [Pseudomonas sp. zfem005]WCD80582.1 TonB system transport protein ExbD [Pseudomonas sp. TUM22785]